MKVSSRFKPLWFPTSPAHYRHLSFCQGHEKKKLRNSSDPSFPLLPRQLPALPDRQHAAGRHRDHRRRPAAAVSRRPLRPLVLQLPRRPGLRRRPPDVLDPRGPGSEWVVSALLSPVGGRVARIIDEQAGCRLRLLCVCLQRHKFPINETNYFQ